MLAIVMFRSCNPAPDSSCEDESQAGMTQCAIDRLDQEAVRLRAAEDAAKAAAENERQREVLARSTAAWEAYRDAECARRTESYFYGSVYPMFFAHCLDKLAKERAEELQTKWY
jgi:uncharacterized protein YecT (DUF1311 family)